MPTFLIFHNPKKLLLLRPPILFYLFHIVFPLLPPQWLAQSRTNFFPLFVSSSPHNSSTQKISESVKDIEHSTIAFKVEKKKNWNNNVPMTMTMRMMIKYAVSNLLFLFYNFLFFYYLFLAPNVYSTMKQLLQMESGIRYAVCANEFIDFFPVLSPSLW